MARMELNRTFFRKCFVCDREEDVTFSSDFVSNSGRCSGYLLLRIIALEYRLFMFLMRHCCVKFVLDIKTHEFLVVVSTKNGSHYVVTFENPTLVTCISQKFRTVRKSVSSVRFPSSNWPNSNPPVDC